jgi:hypothetical protein
MQSDRNVRRMTLRQLLTSVEKCSRDLSEQIQTTLLARTTDCRDLSRPVRRRSHYPTVVSIVNALAKLQIADEELDALGTFLLDQLEAIRDSAQRERVNRR